MVGNFIKHGIEPDPNAEDRELLKKNLEARPNLVKEQRFKKTENLWKFAIGEMEDYNNLNLNPPNFYYD
jgi:hypothetical protein